MTAEPTSTSKTVIKRLRAQGYDNLADTHAEILALRAHILALEEALRTAKAESLVEAASHSIELRRDGIGGLARISVANWLRNRAAALSPAPAKADQR